MRPLIVAAILCVASSYSLSQPVLFEYWPGWNQGGQLIIADIEMDKSKGIVHFGAYITQTTRPYFDSTSWDYIGGYAYTVPDLIYRAKQKGVPVFFSMANVAAYGGNNSIMSFIVADSARCQDFVNYTVAYMARKGYAGGEINWEWPLSSDRVGYGRMMRMFRRAFDQWPVRGVLLHTLYVRAGNGVGDYGAYEVKSVDASADYHLQEMYTLQAEQTNRRLGYTCALDNANCNDGDPWDAPGGYYDAGSIKDSTHNTDAGWNMGPAGLVRQGWSRKKIVVGLGFGYYHRGSSQPLLVGGTNVGAAQNYYEFNYSDVIGPKWGHIPKKWDDEAGQQFMNWFENGRYNHVTYEEERSLALKAESIIGDGYGGIFIYELGAGKVDYDGYTGPEQPLLDALYAAMYDSTFVPPLDTTTQPPEPEPCDPETVWAKADTVYLPRVCPACPPCPDCPPPTQPPTTSIKAIYTNDALAAPWIDASWGGIPNYRSTDQAQQGTSVKVSTAAWGALRIHRGTWGQEKLLKPSEYSAFVVSYYAPATTPLRLVFSNATQSTYTEVVAGPHWLTTTIPAAELPSGGFYDVYIQNYTDLSKTIYFDNIHTK